MTFDWVKNEVKVVGGGASAKRFQSHAEMANERFRGTSACTLLQLVSHMRKPPLDVGGGAAGGGGGGNPGSVGGSGGAGSGLMRMGGGGGGRTPIMQ